MNADRELVDRFLTKTQHMSLREAENRTKVGYGTMQRLRKGYRRKGGWKRIEYDTRVRIMAYLDAAPPDPNFRDGALYVVERMEAALADLREGLALTPNDPDGDHAAVLAVEAVREARRGKDLQKPRRRTSG